MAYGPTAAKLLTYENFQKALSTVPKNVKISFAGFSEPFLNKRAMDMMEYAQAQGHEIALYSTCVGLKAEDVPRLAAMKIEEFVFHLPDDLGIAQIPDNATYRDTLSAVLRTVHIRNFSRMGSDFVSNERAGNCEGVEKRHIYGPIHCGKLIDPEFVMLPDGRVTLCCMDWNLEHPIGNLFTQSWDDLVHGPEYQRVIRAAHGFNAPVLCRSCKVATPVFSKKNVLRMAGRTVTLVTGEEWKTGSVLTT
jgi:Iron-sulfur cluster-binding domain